MVQASQKPVIATVVIATLVLLLGMYISVGSYPEAPEAQAIDFPSANEIAAAVVIPTMNGNLSLDNDKINEIYDEIFKNSDWENDAEALAIEELEDDDYEALAEFLEIDEDDINNVIIKEIEVIANGDDTDDKNAMVHFKLKVYYEAEFGVDINAKETIYCQVEIEDEDVEEIDFGDVYDIFD